MTNNASMEDEAKDDTPFKELVPMADAPIAPAHGIAAIALNLAMKYYDMSTIKDGAMYQQYKLEGRNIETIHLDMVFETALKIEVHLLGASDRIAKIIVDAIANAPEEGNNNEHKP